MSVIELNPSILNTSAPDGPAAGTAPAMGGAEATTTEPQSIAAAHAQVVIPPATGATGDSGGTIVPADFHFTETQYEPPADVTREELSKLSQDDLLTGLKKRYLSTRQSFGQFGRDITTLMQFYDEVVEQCSCERVSKNRNGKPTLEQAFLAIGWNYEAARKAKQRYVAAMAALPAYAPPPKPLQLTEGDKVKAGNGTEGIVQNVHESAAKADVLFKDRSEAVTLPTSELKKVIVPVKKIKVGERLICQDTGAELVYEGNGKFSRNKIPTLLEKQREREMIEVKAKQEREKAKAEEKERQIELRKAEAARRDLEKIAAVQAKKEATLQKKAEAIAAKAKKLAHKAKAKSVAQKAAKTKLVKVARIGNTGEFGVFPDLCFECTTANALTIGTQQMCEAERDRLNTKRASKVSDLACDKMSDETNVRQEAPALL